MVTYNIRKICYTKIARYYNNPQLLTMVIANKFINEGIDVNSESVTRSIMDCIKAKSDIIGVILLRDINKITQYVQSL